MEAVGDGGMTRLYLIRHAEADGNLYRVAHGHCNGLITNYRGYQQIDALRERFRKVDIDAVYISDLYVSTALMRSCNAYDIGTGVISSRLAREVACVAIDTADTVDIGWIGIRGKALRPIEEAFLRHLAHQLEMAKA